MSRLTINTVGALLISISLVSVSYAASNNKVPPGQEKKIVAECVEQGGVYVDGECIITEPPPPVESECTVETQFEDCVGDNTSSTGPGICIVDQEGVGQCDYLYRQSCTNDKQCAEYLGVEDSPYICCTRFNVDRCMNPMLCR